MDHIRRLGDLEKYGIRPLTGEADALGFRILCDLTQHGATIFCETFGLLNTDGLAQNWNSGAVASVMLTGDAVRPLAIMAFAKREQYPIIVTDKGVYALGRGDKYRQVDAPPFEHQIHWHGSSEDSWMRWLDEEYGKIERVIHAPGPQPREGFRNEHQMSQRTT